jgi:hypothetical protein
MELPYEELIGWMEYFRRRPHGWREDNRAAIIAMSFGGGKVRPEDLFDSLRVLKEESKVQEETHAAANFAQKFFDRFSKQFTEKDPFKDDEVQLQLEGFRA